MIFNNKINEELTPEEIEKKKQFAINSQMRMYLSRKLIELLSTIDHPISKELLNISKENIKFDITFMDLSSKKDGTVTFIKTVKLKKLSNDKNIDVKVARNDYSSELWTGNQREQPTKIGKPITSMFMGKVIDGLKTYNIDKKPKDHEGKLITTYSNTVRKSDVENFINDFKAKVEQQDDKFKIVYGKDILKYYLESNYSEGGSSTLGGSCMRQEKKNVYMTMYADNDPSSDAFSHIGMLIYLDDYDKILARSIIWFNSIKPERGRTFMDRIYYNHDKYKGIFINYAKQNNWLYKAEQTYSNTDYIDPKDNNRHRLSIVFRIKNKEYDYYPYVDTLYNFTPETGRIATKTNPKSKKYKILILRDTGGAHE